MFYSPYNTYQFINRFIPNLKYNYPGQVDMSDLLEALQGKRDGDKGFVGGRGEGVKSFLHGSYTSEKVPGTQSINIESLYILEYLLPERNIL